jgi:alpha-N-arabinofuranosidase
MFDAHLVVHPAFVVAPVPDRLFGSFVEHMGRCVYTGIYEPTHPSATADGFRQDVLDLVVELGVTTVRYPGGNFVSGYRWEDGVGPRENRPQRLDLAWHATESNEFGLGEFIRWARRAEVEPMLAVNLGTRGIQEAADLLEYANHPAGTALSDLRVSHGAARPYDVRMWCLGNEMDGPWQLGHKTAREYGRLAAETAMAMRRIDPSLELVVCGSSNARMPTFGSWENEVLELTWDQADWLSLHSYFEPLNGDDASFLASGVGMDRCIEAVATTVDAVGARRHSDKKIKLSFDEWNVWYEARFDNTFAGANWDPAAPLIEDEYTVMDAVAFGGLILSLLRHCDRVQAASLAQLVNVIGPIRTEPGGPAWRQTIFHPFAQAAARARGQVLRGALTAPTYDTAQWGAAPLCDAVLTSDPGRGMSTLFAINRSADEPASLSVELSGFAPQEVAESWVLADADPNAANTAEAPNRVAPVPLEKCELRDGQLQLELPPLSWTMTVLRAR